jgi:hypothetical protein
MSHPYEKLVWVVCTALLGACAEAGPATVAPIDSSGPHDSPINDAATDAPATGSCMAAVTCQDAMALGNVSGDTGNDQLSTTGFQSAWIRVRVTEDDSNPFGVKLSITAKLTSPASTKFDLFMYVNSGNDVIECTKTSGTATTNGNTETLRIDWGEGTFSNGNDDSRNVSVEVRGPASGCSAAATWQLELDGDT